MTGDVSLGETIKGLQRLRAQAPDAFAELARTLDSKVEELLAVCRTLEMQLGETGEGAAADLLGVMVLEWETSLDVPALTFPALLGWDGSTGN